MSGDCEQASFPVIDYCMGMDAASRQSFSGVSRGQGQRDLALEVEVEVEKDGNIHIWRRTAQL